MTQSSYLTVDVLNGSTWTTILLDGDWDTKFHWKRSGIDHSLVTIEWDIATNTPSGQYRLTHTGYYKEAITGRLHKYSGTSSTFTVS